MRVSLQQKRKPGNEPPHLRFVESVKVRKTGKSLSWRQKLLLWFWALMTVKCAVLHWAILAWDMPFGPFYIWAPSFGAGAICTIAFLCWEN